MIRRGLLTTALLASTMLVAGPVLAAEPPSRVYGPGLTPSGPDTASASVIEHTLGNGTIDLTPVLHAEDSGGGAVASLNDALAETYLTEPQLLAERARLRATDETVPAALSGWRPQVSYSYAPGWAYGTLTQRQQDPVAKSGFADVTNAESRWTEQTQVTASQPLYRGGRTTAAVAGAEDQVRSERANLIAQEEQSFSNAVSAYVGLIEDQQLYALQVSNVEVLTKQLDATNARFAVGEITRTDVAQAQAALAGAIAQRETAYGTLQTAIATYRSAIGPVPAKLVEPQPLKLPFSTAEAAQAETVANNASVIAATYTDAYAKDQVDSAYAQLMPQVSLTANAAFANQPNTRGLATRGGLVGVSLTAPIYQGGSEYAAIRQAKQTEQQDRKTLDNARRNAVQQAAQYWESYVAAKATVVATRAQIRADEIALDGVEREALAGTETTYDVLLQEQALLTAQVTLVQNLAALVSDSYSLAGAAGRLTAHDLGLNVPFYDEKAYYRDVRNLPFGTGDHATDQPGR